MKDRKGLTAKSSSNRRCNVLLYFVGLCMLYMTYAGKQDSPTINIQKPTTDYVQPFPRVPVSIVATRRVSSLSFAWPACRYQAGYLSSIVKAKNKQAKLAHPQPPRSPLASTLDPRAPPLPVDTTCDEVI